MSDNTNVLEEVAPNTGAEDTTEVSAEQVKKEVLDADGKPTGVILVEEIFEGRGDKEGKFNGAKFWTTEFKTLNDCINHFTKISKNGKPGEETILSLVHAAIGFRMRNKAQSALYAKLDKKNPNHVNEKIIADFVEKGEPIITEQDALEYIPGEREVTALSGLRRQMEGLKKSATELSAKIKQIQKDDPTADISGQKSVLLKQLTKFKEVKALIEVEEAKEQAKLLELAEGLDLENVSL